MISFRISLTWAIVSSLICTVILCSAQQHEPSLPFGEINVVVLTDTHSWVGGHGDKEPDLDADYGHVLSFYQRLQSHCQSANHDLWFVVNGDWIDGTGLATDGDPSSLIPLLEKMPWDAVNVGNHELYRAEVIEYMTRPGGFVEWWGDRYLSSNVVHADNMKPIGNQYRLLHGKKSTVLTFGFLFNMKNNADVVTVKEVETVMQENWFLQALKEDFDAIMVLAHMDVRDDLVNVILSKIRQELGDNMPVQFITGHTHYRGYNNPDNTSASFEAGRYLDTVGFVSFPTKQTVAATDANSTTDSFRYEYLDANIDTLKDTLGVSTLDTDDGQALSKFIAQTQEELGLKEVIGCIPQTFFVNRSIDAQDSLWGFFGNSIVASQFQSQQLFFLGKGAWRYDLFKGEVRVGHVLAVSPFDNELYVWKGIPSKIIAELNRTMNDEGSESNLPSSLPLLPEYVLVSAQPFESSNGTYYDLITDGFEVSSIQTALDQIYPDAAKVTPSVLQNQTTSSIWIQYFRRNTSCPSASGPDHEHKKNRHPGQNPFSNATSTTNILADDRIKLGFVGIACAAIVVLGSVNVWQRGSRYRDVVSAREEATMAAIREYEDEEEGEFV